MTRPLFFAALLAAALLPAGAFAQSQGNAQDRKACTADARRFCRTVLKDGDMAVYSCLQMHAAKLRPACRQRVVGY
ncbi:MAG TPA: hypothetical protein VHA55_07115 [Pseudorhodoplanes sp.]|jgi:hypothetical protein|nr:hypothetical protein [Pseudorhodoplanes sp.]